MYQPIALLNYYLLGRLIFAIALQIAIHLSGESSVLDRLVLLTGLYGFLALIRLIIRPERSYLVDFVLDIFFVSGIVYTGFYFYSYSYLTLLYLFPIFFASLSLKTRVVLVFPFLTTILYGAIYYLAGILFEKDSLINITLHLFSFMLISFAGNQVNEKLSRQENYIKKLEQERIRMQGYERLFRVSADLAHELRNPLASISAAIQFIREGKDVSDFIDMLEEETRKISNLVKDFLIFSRPSDAPKEGIELSHLLHKMVDENRHGDVKIELKTVDNLNTRANRTFLEAAIGNIVKNALEAAKGVVRITAERAAHSEILGVSSRYGYIAIKVEDDGHGLPEDLRDKVFEPFFTTKPKGTGLGLAIAYRIITDIGGSIFIDNSSLGGACFTILIPEDTVSVTAL